MFILRRRFWICLLKLVPLLFIGGMIKLQIPELRYDLGRQAPIVLSAADDLVPERFPRATFVSIAGTPDFEKAFVYRRYGLSYTYFHVEPYGMRLVVRTWDAVTDEWKELDRFLGKLRPFSRQPFSYRIREIHRDKFGIDLPSDAFFLALDDVPRLSGWQLGAALLASVMWLVMFYSFFVHRWWRGKPVNGQGRGPEAGEQASLADDGTHPQPTGKSR